MIKQINVTNTGIKLGKRSSMSTCPVSRALIASGCKRPCVEGNIASFSLYGKRQKVMLSKKVQDFIQNFDLQRPVKPFKFNIRLKRS